MRKAIWIGAALLALLALSVVGYRSLASHSIVSSTSSLATLVTKENKTSSEAELFRPSVPVAQDDSPKIRSPASLANTPEARPVTTNPELLRFLDRNQSDRVTPDISARLPILTDPSDIELVARVVADTSDDDAVRNEAMNLLDRCDYPHMESLVLAVLDNPNEKPRFRAFAMQRLGMLAAPDEKTVIQPIATRLRTALDDRHAEVRREALLALIRIRDSQALVIIKNGLSDPKWSDSYDLIIRCLYEIGDQSARSDIRRFLRSHREQERIAALYVLGEWQDAVSADAFLEAASDESSARIRRAGLRAHERLRNDKSQ